MPNRPRGSRDLVSPVSREPSGSFRPVLDAITDVYQQLLFRAPTARETAKARLRFCAAFRSRERRTAAIRAGAIREHLGIRPLKLEMDIVNQCNIRCIMCHFAGPDYSYSTRPRRELSVENFAVIADQLFPYLAELSLSISTEPLLHRRLSEILEATRRYRVPFVYMHTNGLLLNEPIADALVREGVHQVSISIDGATRETYERIRRGASFDTLLENIDILMRAREGRRSKTPRLAFNVVLMRSNIRELPDLIRLARQLGVATVGAVHMVPLSTADATEDESLIHDKDLCNQVLGQARSLAKTLGVDVTLPDPFGSPHPAGPESSLETEHRDLHFVGKRKRDSETPACLFPWHFIGLDSDGNLMPCGWWYDQPPMGNVLHEPFLEIWNGPAYSQLRHELASGSPREGCRTCPSAGMGSVDDASAFTPRRPV